MNGPAIVAMERCISTLMVDGAAAEASKASSLGELVDVLCVARGVSRSEVLELDLEPSMAQLIGQCHRRLEMAVADATGMPLDSSWDLESAWSQLFNRGWARFSREVGTLMPLTFPLGRWIFANAIVAISAITAGWHFNAWGLAWIPSAALLAITSEWAPRHPVPFSEFSTLVGSYAHKNQIRASEWCGRRKVSLTVEQLVRAVMAEEYEVEPDTLSDGESFPSRPPSFWAEYGLGGYYYPPARQLRAPKDC